jgi:apolipoprotein N-acyltransferase
MRGMDRLSRYIQNYPGLLMLLAGVGAATGFSPFGLWPITLLAFALLMHCTIIAPGFKAAASYGWLFGFGHFAFGLSWMAHAFTYQDAMPVALGWFASPLLSLYLAIFPALATLAAYGLGRSRSPLGFTFIFAACWIVSEILRAKVLTGFAWNPLSSAFVDVAFVIKLVGTYGASGIVILASGSVWLALRRYWRMAAMAFALPAFALIYAFMDQAQPIPQSVKTLLHVVQPNIGQQDKYRDGFEAENFSKLTKFTKVVRSVGSGAAQTSARPRLILWPEAAIPDFIGEKDLDAFDARMRIAGLMQPGDILLTGADKIFKKTTIHAGYSETRWVGAANSLFALDHKGRILWRYDKAHLVPFGEYLPMRSLLKPLGLARLVPGDLDFWPGSGPRSLSIPNGIKIGPQICYEIVFSGEVTDRKNRPDFLFNPSNDAWFGNWYKPQILAQSRLRAIEEGLPVVRATPTGKSVIIDADGRVLKMLQGDVAGSIIADLPPAHPPTLFARFGNTLPLGLAALLLLIAMLLPVAPLPLAQDRTSR